MILCEPAYVCYMKSKTWQTMTQLAFQAHDTVCLKRHVTELTFQAHDTHSPEKAHGTISLKRHMIRWIVLVQVRFKCKFWLLQACNELVVLIVMGHLHKESNNYLKLNLEFHDNKGFWLDVTKFQKLKCTNL